MTLIDPTTLYCDTVDARAIDKDWTANAYDENDERSWEWAEYVTCHECDRRVVAVNGDMVEHDTREDDGSEDFDATRCEGSGVGHPSAEGPMMSHWWPCKWKGLDLAAAAERLEHVGCVCPVIVDGDEGIALTGGGMDLSWELCLSFVALGSLPPLALCRDLPLMGGLRYDERIISVLAAADRSHEVMEAWIATGRRNLAHLRTTLSSQGFGEANPLGVPDDEIKLAHTVAALVILAPEADLSIDTAVELYCKGGRS